MCRRSHVPFPKGWEAHQWGGRPSGSVRNPETHLFLFSFLVQPLLFLSSSLLTGCFMGLPLFPSGSSCCNFRLFPQYIQYVSSQWISVKEISCSYRMLLDNINTWELLCKIRFRLPGSRVVSCKVFFFPQVLNFLVCSRWMVSIDFRQRYFYCAYIMQESCLKKSKYFLLCTFMDVSSSPKLELLQVFSGTFIYVK